MLVVQDNYTSLFNIVENFGTWLKNYRQEADLSLRELEARIGKICTFGYLNQLEKEVKGKNGEPFMPDEAIVEALAKALNRPLDEARHAAGYARTDSANSLNIEGVGSIQFEKGIKFTEKGKEQIEIAIKMAVAMADKENE